MANDIVYRLHHFGLLCQDMEQSYHAYQEIFGMQLTSRWFNRNLLDLSFFGRGSDATVELVGKPHLSYEETFIAKHGYGINHLSILVDDAALAFDDLVSKGVKVAWEPKKVLDLWQCGFYDPDGLLFEVFSPIDPDVPMGVSDMKCDPEGICLDHISILTPDLKRSQKFYAEKLGFNTLLEYLPGGGGFIFMADPDYDGRQHGFKLEIIGPPGLEAREEVMMKKHGACFDHIAFIANDVKAAWEAVIGKGARKMDDPVQGYGVWMAWVNDPDGNDIEIMSPFDPQALLEAMRTGVPVDIS